MKIRTFALALGAALISAVLFGAPVAQAAPPAHTVSASATADTWWWWPWGHKDCHKKEPEKKPCDKKCDDKKTEFSYMLSTFTVAPVVDPDDRSTWQLADGVSAYTLTLTAKDTKGKAMTNLALTDIRFTVTSPDVNLTAIRNNGDGTYVVLATSTTVVLDATARVAYKGLLVGAPVWVLFTDV